MTRSVRSMTGAALAAALLTSGSALAQFPAPPPAPAPVPEAVPPAPPQEMPPAAAPLPAAPVAQAASDLDQFVGHWGVGFMGTSQVPLGLDGNTGALLNATIPAIGIRYWQTPRMGFDIGLGLGFSGGSQEAAGISTDKNGTFGFLLTGGVPLALLNSRHVSFQVIPYLVLAYGATSTGTGIAKIDESGFRLNLGGRIGFEVFFGFIGIPQLALNATVGAEFSYTKYGASSGGQTASDSTYGFTTTVQNNPWDIFTGNLAARYYF